MNCIIYCRVSTKEQVELTGSLAYQERLCRDYAKRNGYEVVKVFVEKGESAKTTDRTQLKRLLDFLSKNHKSVDAIIVHKLDRLARNMVDHTGLVASFTKMGIDIKSATENLDDSPAGKLTKNMIAAIAQFDNDVRSERTRTGMKEAVQEGRWCWKAPLGYRQFRDEEKKPHIEHSSDSPFIADAFALAEEGTKRQTEIVIILKRKGFNRITEGLLNRILRNPLYAGLIKVDWFPDYIKATHKPIISEETFFKVQQILDGKRPHIAPKARNHPDFPLRNFVRCPKCGEKVTGGWSKGRHKKYPYYHCRVKGCGGVSVRKEVLESAFYEHLKTLQPKEDMVALFKVTVVAVWKKKQEESIKEEYRLEQDLKKLREKKDRIDELMIKSVFDDQTYRQKASEVENEILAKQVQLNDTRIELNDVEACLNYCERFLLNLASLWVNANLDNKQRLQRLLFPDKIFYENGKVRTTATSSIISQLQQNPTKESQVVAPWGFEPQSLA